MRTVLLLIDAGTGMPGNANLTVAVFSIVAPCPIEGPDTPTAASRSTGNQWLAAAFLCVVVVQAGFTMATAPRPGELVARQTATNRREQAQSGRESVIRP